MRKFKAELIGILSVLCVSVAPISSVHAAEKHPFLDIRGMYAEDAISFLYQQGMVNGVGSESFAPNQLMKRKHFAILLSRVLGLQPLYLKESSFNDLSVDQLESGYVEALSKMGIMKGLASSQFGGEHVITRQDVAVILYQVFGEDKLDSSSKAASSYQDQQHIADYATKAVEYVTTSGLMQGYQGNFYPQKPLTRAEAAVVAKKIVNKRESEEKASISVSPEKIIAFSGETVQIKWTKHDSPLSFSPVWGFDHPKIGTISTDGTFTARMHGSGMITLNIGDQLYRIPVEVVENKVTEEN